MARIYDIHNYLDELIESVNPPKKKKNTNGKNKKEKIVLNEEEQQREDEKKQIVLAQKVVRQDKEMFSVDYTYIDFRFLVLGDKLRNIKKGEKKKVVFDDFYLANIIEKIDENNNEIFNQ